MQLPPGVPMARSVRPLDPGRDGPGELGRSAEPLLQARIGRAVLLDRFGSGLLAVLAQPEVALHLLEQRRTQTQGEPGDDRVHEELHARNRSIAPRRSRLGAGIRTVGARLVERPVGLAPELLRGAPE